MSNLVFEDGVEDLLAEAYEAAFKRQPTGGWFKAIAMRVGITGDVATLDEAAEAIGVTRERVRQVMAKVEAQLKGMTVPGAQEIAETIVARSPVPEPIGRVLASSGMTRPTLTGRAFLNILKLTGTSAANLVGTDLVRIDGWLVEESEVQVMKAVFMAKKHTSSYGMTTIEEIRQALARPDNPLDAADIRRVLGDWC